MSKAVFEQIKEGLEEVRISVRNQRALTDQVTIAVNALQAIALGDEPAHELAKDALYRIIALIPEPPLTD